MTTRHKLTLALASAALILAGCGGYGKDPGMSSEHSEHPGAGDKTQQRAELMRRPSIEEATDRYERMQTEIRERLNAETGPWHWYQNRGVSAAGCDKYAGLGGESRSLPRWTFDGNLPDEKWPQAARIVQEITHNYGFQPPIKLADQPGDHQFTVDDHYGARVRFGTAKNTLISIHTGCHLPQAEKDKSAPKPQGQAAPDAADTSTPQAKPAGSKDFGPFDPARFSSPRN